MRTEETVDITVNELAKILAKHFKARSVEIESAEVASLKNQHHPETKVIGVGGVLTLTITRNL